MLVLISLAAHAGDIASNSLNSVPLFYGLMGENPRYQAAASKAQEAFLIQTGVTPAADKTANVVTQKVTDQATKTIESNTPFKAKDVFFVGGAAYAVCIKHQVTSKFKDPLFPTMSHTVTVGKDSGSFNLSLPF